MVLFSNADAMSHGLCIEPVPADVPAGETKNSDAQTNKCDNEIKITATILESAVI
jgi:hypothetical protein